MRRSHKLFCRFVIILLLAIVNYAAHANCDCGDYCGACGSETPKYIYAALSNLQGCPEDFHEEASQSYPCFDGTMGIVCRQDPMYSCGYYYNGPSFSVEGSPFDFRLSFYINLSAPDGKTEFSVIVQEDCGGWYDLFWSTTSAEQSCSSSGSAGFSSLCNVPFPDIESGTVSWAPLILADGNCPCGEANEIPENCDEFSCGTLDQYAFIEGGAAYYNGPFLVYSPSKCETNAKAGNTIQAAKIVCPGAQLVSASAQSSAPRDIIVSPQNSDCSPGSSANFSIRALRGKGTVTLTATFYQEAYSEECIARKTTKTVTILVQPDPGDECCTDSYKPILLNGSPGNVSTPIRAGVNPLEEWPKASIYRADEFTDIEVIMPGRFTPVIFNNGKAPGYMRGWSAQIDESNAVIVVSPENTKYVYEHNSGYKIHFIKNSQNQNIVEFIYDGNGLPFRQNDLIDANLYISYHYANGFLTEIREYAGDYYRQYLLEYDSGKICFISGQCSECSENGGRKYFYNPNGTIKYEKSIDNEILFEYVFDSQQRLIEKWFGSKHANKPVKTTDYTDTEDGYTADIKDYVDDVNFRASREYRTKADILTERITCELLNENLDSPAGQTFTEEYIHDISDSTGLINKLTLVKPGTGSARTEYIFDVNCGEILRQTAYDYNDNSVTELENIYEYLDISGRPTNQPGDIFLARIIQSKDVHKASTFYQYDDASNYPSKILLPDEQVRQFVYDSEKQVIAHSFIDNNSTRLLAEVYYNYDDFGNLISESCSDANDINDTIEYRYNDFGEVVRIISAAGVVTAKSYDDFGRLISEYTLADANDIELDQPDLISQKYYSYDANGLLISESVAIDTGRFEFDCPDNRIYTRYEYDKLGRLVKIIEDANGTALQTAFEYNRMDEIVKITNPGGKWTEYAYDGRGLITNEITGFGDDEILITEYEYDENGNCIRQAETDDTTSILEYDDFDRIKTHRLPNDSFVNYQYNSAGQVTYQTLYDVNQTALQQTVYDYDTSGRCRGIRQRQTCGIDDDANDFEILYAFDCLDNVIQKTIKADSEVNDIVTRYEFDGKNRITKIIDAMSNAEKFVYDKDGNIKSITNSLNLVTVNTFDHFGRIIKTQTPNGNYKTYIYDSLGRCINETLFDSSDSAIEQKRYEYDGLDNISKAITMYDPASHLPVNPAIDNVIVYSFNSFSGLVESETTLYDENKQAIELFEYDNIGRLAAITDAAGSRTEILYDTNVQGRISGQILTIKDGNDLRSISTHLEYDSGGRIIESRIDSNLVTQFFYDGADRVIKQIKPGGLEIAYGYDSFDNVKRVAQADSVAEFEYDRTGRLISITAYEPNSQKTIFEYEKNARVTKIIYADGREEKFKYDAAGKITEKTLRNTEKIYFCYDSEDNLKWLSDDPDGPEGNAETAEFLIEFEHNPNGLITYAGKIVNGQVVSQSEFKYNGLGKITTESTSLFELEPVIIEYDYDQAGNIISQMADWSRLDFTHDGLGRIKTISRNDSSIAEIQYFGSTVSRQKLLEPGIEYTAGFDQIGRINQYKSIESENSILDFIYSYDNASRRSNCIYNHLENSPTDEYEFDVAGRITKAEYADGLFEEFAYDALGNRTEVQSKYGFTDTYNHNELNQYTKVHTDFNFFGFTMDSNLYWDDNGRLSYEELNYLEYEYDRLGNLTKVKIQGWPVAEFVYDPLGRRIRKTTQDCDTIYYYDLNNRIAAEYEINQAGEPVFIAEYIYGNGNTDIIARFLYDKPYDSNSIKKLAEFCDTYLYGAGQQGFDSEYDYDSSGLVDLQDFSVFAKENHISLPEHDNSEKHWYFLKDAVGSVTAVVGGKYNRPGERDFFRYDVFGNPDHASAVGGDFMFAGMRYDSEIGKYYCSNRYYDADTGRFISMDPLLFADGFNPYEYAKNNPVMYTDRLGLKSSIAEEIEFLIGRGNIRTAAKRLTQEVKKTCEKIDSDCSSRRCIAGLVNPSCRKAEKCYELYRNAIEYDKNLNSECAKAAAIGTLAGTAQGLLNTVNGVQDIAVSTANLGMGIWNFSGALICDKELEYIVSPDWSKDLAVKESQTAHNISKFLGSQGLVTVMTAGAGSGQAGKQAGEGIYEFTASSGKTYVGQSSNIPRRIVEHIKSGKLLAKNAKTLKTTQVGGGRIAREIAEQARIDRLGGVKNLENARNVIGPARSYLLKK